jgi:hypothetical protein
MPDLVSELIDKQLTDYSEAWGKPGDLLWFLKADNDNYYSHL